MTGLKLVPKFFGGQGAPENAKIRECIFWVGSESPPEPCGALFQIPKGAAQLREVEGEAHIYNELSMLPSPKFSKAQRFSMIERNLSCAHALGLTIFCLLQTRPSNL